MGSQAWDVTRGPAIAIAAVAVAFGLLEVMFPRGAGASTYPTASAAIMLAAIAGGLPGGLMAVALSCAVVAYGHLPTIGVLHVDRVDDLLGLATFALNGLLVAMAGALLGRRVAGRVRADGSTSAPSRAGVLEPGSQVVAGAQPRRAQGRAQAAALVKPLTDREVEVLGLLAAGHSNEDIAGSLYLSLNTVKTHLKNIYGKLGVTSRTQAAARGLALGLIDAPVSSTDWEDRPPHRQRSVVRAACAGGVCGRRSGEGDQGGSVPSCSLTARHTGTSQHRPGRVASEFLGERVRARWAARSRDDHEVGAHVVRDLEAVSNGAPAAGSRCRALEESPLRVVRPPPGTGRLIGR